MRYKNVDSQQKESLDISCKERFKTDKEARNSFLALIGTKIERPTDQKIDGLGNDEFRRLLSGEKQKSEPLLSESNTRQKRIEEVDKQIEIIKKLKELFDEGILTREEFNSEKRYLID